FFQAEDGIRDDLVTGVQTCALPISKDVESFEFVDGVWVTHPRTMIPVALVLRHGLVELEGARKASEGQHTKAEMVYQYLAGPRRSEERRVGKGWRCGRWT